MRLFSRLLSIFQPAKKEEKKAKQGTKKRPAQRAVSTKQRIVSMFILVMFFTATVYAEPASAGFFDSVKNAFNAVKDNIEGGIAGAIAGAAAGAMVGSAVPGIGTAIGAAVGAVVGFVGGVYVEYKAKNTVNGILNPGSGGDSGATLTAGENATKEDLSTDKDIMEKYQLVDDASANATRELTELLAKMATQPAQYSVQMWGATGNIQVELFGPDEIRGFSAFPVKLRILTAADPIKQNVIHLNKVTMYVIRSDTGTAYYTYTKTFGPNETSLNGDAYTVTTFLKVPDDLDVAVKNALETGQITQDLIEQLKNAKTPSFEIYIRVEATKEDWAYVNNTWQHVRDIQLTVEAQTVSAYTHVTATSDVVLFQTGLDASLPADMANLVMSKFAPFIAQQWGGISDIMIRPYATPVHVANSTATWQFFVAPNVGFYKMFDDNPKVYDDFEVFAIRVLQGGQYELADRRPNPLGDLTVESTKQAYGVIKYTFGPDIVNYKVYGLGLIWFERDDGTKIPVWVLVQPHMTVLDPEKLALDDTRVQRILPIFDDNKITETELQTLKAELESAKQDIQEKIQAAQQLKAMAEANGNTEAAQYADRAIKYYQLELQMLDQAAQTDDAQMALNYLNAAKKYEYAGDFEKQAAEKANMGDIEGARYLDSQAQDYKEQADQYVPHLNFSGLADSILNNLKDWKMLLLLAVLIIGGYYLFGRMGALIGLGIWLAIVIGIPVLKALAAWIHAKI